MSFVERKWASRFLLRALKTLPIIIMALADILKKKFLMKYYRRVLEWFQGLDNELFMTRSQAHIAESNSCLHTKGELLKCYLPFLPDLIIVQSYIILINYLINLII